MIIAAAKVILDFWGNEEINDKRKLIATLADKLLHAHKVELTEVDEVHDLERCVLGLSFCARDMPSAKDRMKSLLLFIDQNSPARVVTELPDFQQFE